MKINKIFLMAGLAMMSFFVSSCSDDDEDYTPGKPAGSYNITFGEQSTVVLSLEDSSFPITLTRADAGAAVTVPVEAVSVPSFMSVPETVTFESGATEATINVSVGSEMEAFVDYTVILQIAEEYTNPYKVQDLAPRFTATVYKEDYKHYATATYYDDFWYGDSWEQEIEYSEYMDLYRVKMNPETEYSWTFYFKWDGKKEAGSKFAITDNNGKENTAAQPTGLVHSSYGAVSATWSKADASGWDNDEQGLLIPWKWTVSAGSFGVYYHVIYL